MSKINLPNINPRLLLTSSGDVVNVIGWFILKNGWEYYIIEDQQNKDNIVMAYVLGDYNELGFVDLEEVAPYIMSMAKGKNDLYEIDSPNEEGFRWINSIIELDEENIAYVAEALHAVLSLHHEGQNSKKYELLSMSPFKPSHFWSESKVEEENLFFQEIENLSDDDDALEDLMMTILYLIKDEDEDEDEDYENNCEYTISTIHKLVSYFGAEKEDKLNKLKKELDELYGAYENDDFDINDYSDSPLFRMAEYEKEEKLRNLIARCLEKTFPLIPKKGNPNSDENNEFNELRNEVEKYFSKFLRSDIDYDIKNALDYYYHDDDETEVVLYISGPRTYLLSYDYDKMTYFLQEEIYTPETRFEPSDVDSVDVKGMTNIEHLEDILAYIVKKFDDEKRSWEYEKEALYGDGEGEDWMGEETDTHYSDGYPKKTNPTTKQFIFVNTKGTSRKFWSIRKSRRGKNIYVVSYGRLGYTPKEKIVKCNDLKKLISSKVKSGYKKVTAIAFKKLNKLNSKNKLTKNKPRKIKAKLSLRSRRSQKDKESSIKIHRFKNSEDRFERPRGAYPNDKILKEMSIYCNQVSKKYLHLLVDYNGSCIIGDGVKVLAIEGRNRKPSFVTVFSDKKMIQTDQSKYFKEIEKELKKEYPEYADLIEYESGHMD